MYVCIAMVYKGKGSGIGMAFEIHGGAGYYMALAVGKETGIAYIAY